MTGTFQLRVVAMVVGAMILIVGVDVAGRMLTAAGFSPFFVAWARFALAAVVLAPVCGLQRGEMQLLLRPALILRACLIAGGIACILTALKTEQLATVFGGFFVPFRMILEKIIFPTDFIIADPLKTTMVFLRHSKQGEESTCIQPFCRFLGRKLLRNDNKSPSIIPNEINIHPLSFRTQTRPTSDECEKSKTTQTTSSQVPSQPQ